MIWDENKLARNQIYFGSHQKMIDQISLNLSKHFTISFANNFVAFKYQLSRLSKFELKYNRNEITGKMHSF